MFIKFSFFRKEDNYFLRSVYIFLSSRQDAQPNFVASSEWAPNTWKYPAPKFISKIDLLLGETKDTNNTVQHRLCAQRISTSSLWAPTHRLHCMCIPSSVKKDSLSLLATTSTFKDTLANMFTLGKVASGKLPQGEVHTFVIPVCLHYVRFEGAVPCLQLCQNYSCCCLSLSENISQKNRIWTTFMLIKRGKVLRWCVRVFD